MGERILVTGATGNVGREVVRCLAANGGVEIVGAVRQLAEGAASGLPATRWVPFDFEDHATFGPALAGIDRVFLVRPPQIEDITRTLGPFISAARAAGVRHFVFLSLLGVEGNPFVPHRKVEDALRASGVPSTMLRASFFMQNLDTTHRGEVRAGALQVPTGRGKTSFIDVRDIAAVGAKALVGPPADGAWPLTGSEALDYFEVARILSEELGREIRFANPGIFGFRRHQLKAGRPKAFVNVMMMIYLVVRLGRAGRVTDDVEQILGRKPITLRTYARDYRDAWIG